MRKMLNKKSGNFRLALYLILCVAIVGADQLSKWLAVRFLRPVGDYPLFSGVFHLTYVENSGAAFGMFKDIPWLFMLVSTVTIVVMIGFLIYYRDHAGALLGVAIAFVTGGGIGNMIDRLRLGYVVDFFNFELINFAVFNVADSFVCVGAALLFITVLLGSRSEKAKTVPDGAQAQDAPEIQDKEEK